uniref:gap junction Cx32.2 protein-like n=1 Tax=Monopterus albus TaxID=43700 RepID=UPI0009B3D447|nr:gap junction Cx32.2 protein-like [Monopterus albus]
MHIQEMGFLSSLLCKWQSQATFIGKAVLPVLLLIRMVILGAAAQTAWVDDEQDFECDTQQPGCSVACYNEFTPVSAERFWTLQLVLVWAPGLVFLCYLIHLTIQENQVRRGDGEVKGHALGAYLACMVSVILVEVGFTVAQPIVFGFQARNDQLCSVSPCPFRVDCASPHAWEKTAFLGIMLAASCASLLLCVVELVCVLCRARQRQPDGAKALRSTSQVKERQCFLSQLLSLWHSHAGLLGRTVLPVLQLMRLVILGAAVQPVWHKDFNDFICNTLQPGCSQTAFNQASFFPLHHYWTLQVVLVLAPALIFFCYLVHLVFKGKQEAPGAQDKSYVNGAYLGQLSAVFLLEVAFAVGQAVTFGFSLSTNISVYSTLCHHRVDCFISQANEKTLFMNIMFSVACLSALLTVVEMCMVLQRDRQRKEKQQKNNILETLALQMKSAEKEEADTAEGNEDCMKLNTES